MKTMDLLKELLMKGKGLTDQEWQVLWDRGFSSYPRTGDCAECDNTGTMVNTILIHKEGLRISYCICFNCAEKVKE